MAFEIENFSNVWPELAVWMDERCATASIVSSAPHFVDTNFSPLLSLIVVHTALE
jgi:hypothetical protein